MAVRPMVAARGASAPAAWILSRDAALYSTQRLLTAARQAGLDARVVHPRGVDLVIPPPVTGVPELVIPRAGSRAGRATLHALRQLELAGACVVNRADAVETAQDKWRCAQVLASHGVPVPAAVLPRGPTDLARAAAALGGMPVVLKLLRGSHGDGVMLARTAASLQWQAHALWSAGHEFLLQAFVAEARGTDLRIIVAGDRVVAAMRRRARRGEFRANVHRGGRVVPAVLDARTRAVALAAVRAVGLGVAGVDVVLARSGPQVLEVNASPGLRGIEAATGVDVAGAIVSAGLQAVRTHRRVA